MNDRRKIFGITGRKWKRGMRKMQSSVAKTSLRDGVILYIVTKLKTFISRGTCPILTDVSFRNKRKRAAILWSLLVDFVFRRFQQWSLSSTSPTQSALHSLFCPLKIHFNVSVTKTKTVCFFDRGYIYVDNTYMSQVVSSLQVLWLKFVWTYLMRAVISRISALLDFITLIMFGEKCTDKWHMSLSDWIRHRSVGQAFGRSICHCPCNCVFLKCILLSNLQTLGSHERGMILNVVPSVSAGHVATVRRIRPTATGSFVWLPMASRGGCWQPTGSCQDPQFRWVGHAALLGNRIQCYPVSVVRNVKHRVKRTGVDEQGIGIQHLLISSPTVLEMAAQNPFVSLPRQPQGVQKKQWE
jgi:hypothetical protein